MSSKIEHSTVSQIVELHENKSIKEQDQIYRFLFEPHNNWKFFFSFIQGIIFYLATLQTNM